MKKSFFILLCLLPIISAHATVITVDDDGFADFGDIPAAINASQNGDTIVVRPGTYDRTVSFNSMAITLTSENPDDPNVVAATIISVDSGYGVSFDFAEGNNSVLTGFTITGRGIHCYGRRRPLRKTSLPNARISAFAGKTTRLRSFRTTR